MAGQQLGEVSRRGPKQVHPNFIRAGLRNLIHWKDQRKCMREGCLGLALRGYLHCQMHAGATRPGKDGSHGRAESRYLARLEHRGLLPLGLLDLPCWRRLMTFPTKQRAPMRLALLQAWDSRRRQPLRWAQVQKQALAMVAEPGDGRQRVAAWYMANR